MHTTDGAKTDGGHGDGDALDLLLRPAWPAALDRRAVPPETRAGVECIPAGGEPLWWRNGDWRLYVRADGSTGRGDTIASFDGAGGAVVRAVHDPVSGAVRVPFSFAEAFAAYTSEGWRTGSSNRRLSDRNLATFYRVRGLVPRRMQLAARRRLIRAQGVPEFPAWPLDTSVSRLLRFYTHCRLLADGRAAGEFLWFWPAGHTGAVILTHDVESEDGIRRALELADLEQEYGFRSSFNFGAWYHVDRGVLRELTARGFEIGMHGLTHDRALFSSRQAFEHRLPQLAKLAKDLGAVGFRSPATHRIFDWLAELPVEYDCTIPNSDPYEPQPGGCCSLWPFFIGPVVELPYTLPQDHTLLTLLGHRSPQLWLDQASAVEGAHGLVQCVSHPDAGYLGDADKRAVYAEFLRGLTERVRLWRALPREVASWWRRRATADPVVEDLPRGTATIDASAETVVFAPPSA